MNEPDAPRVRVRATLAGGDPAVEADLPHGADPAEHVTRHVAEATGRAAALVGPPTARMNVEGGRPLCTLTYQVLLGDPLRVHRLSAHALLLRDAHVLLTQLAQDTPVPGAWTLPGGGIDPEEDLPETVRREVHEETGLDVAVGDLLDVFSFRVTTPQPSGVIRAFHGLQCIYAADPTDDRTPQVIERGGTTSAVRWVPLTGVGEAHGIPVLPLVTHALTLPR